MTCENSTAWHLLEVLLLCLLSQFPFSKVAVLIVSLMGETDDDKKKTQMMNFFLYPRPFGSSLQFVKFRGRGLGVLQ